MSLNIVPGMKVIGATSAFGFLICSTIHIGSEVFAGATFTNSASEIVAITSKITGPLIIGAGALLFVSAFLVTICKGRASAEEEERESLLSHATDRFRRGDFLSTKGWNAAQYAVAITGASVTAIGIGATIAANIAVSQEHLMRIPHDAGMQVLIGTGVFAAVALLMLCPSCCNSEINVDVECSR